MLQTNKYLTAALLILFPFCAALAQQYENLLHKPYSEKAADLVLLYRELTALNNSTVIANKAGEIKTFAQNHKDKELELEIGLFKAFYASNLAREKTDVEISELRRIMELADKENIPHIKIRAARRIAEIYWEDIKNYELAFEYYLLIEKELNRLQPEDYPDMAADLLKIGLAYYFFRDYTQANTYFEKILAIPETAFNTLSISSAKNTLGLYYQRIEDYDTSDHYFNSVLQSPFEQSVSIWEGIVKGNLGVNLYHKRNYEEAIPLLEFDYQKAIETADYGLAAGAVTVLADIYLEKNQLEVSKRYIDKAISNIKRSNKTDRLRLLYPVMSKWYNIKNQPELSKLYLDSTVIAINEYNEKFSALNMLRAQQKIFIQEQSLELAEINLEKQKKTNERNIFLIIVILLCTTIIIAWFIQRKRQLLKNLKLQETKKELEIAKVKLNNFKRSISEKNTLIEQLQNQSEQEKSSIIYQLQQSTILTDDDWIEFQRAFDKVYPGFIHRLKQTLPDLSTGEIRYFVLSKLNISYREAAAILGVSPNTVQVIRHRIRKKLNLPDTDSMEEIVNAI